MWNKSDRGKITSGQKFKNWFTKKRIIVSSVVAGLVVLLVAVVFLVNGHKTFIVGRTIAALSSMSRFLPITPDEKKELAVLNQLTQSFSQMDNKERTFLILLQNNMELRPGGGFLGQYAIVTIKNGAVTSSYFEDANLLDQTITAKIPPPYPLRRMLQLKNWKFRDSNFSPDFPTNVQEAEYFMRLAGRGTNFDGAIAVNAQVFNDLLQITGPITVPGYSQTFAYPDGALNLEAVVEKAYIMDPKLDSQNRKMIMKNMVPIIIEKLMSPSNLPKLADFLHTEFKDRNIMVYFTDPQLESSVESVSWDGRVNPSVPSDYFMMVDANMGSLKTDYYMKRQITYNVDLTAPKPTVTVDMLYKNTATAGDWRTSDYHTYMRIYVPQGSTLVSTKMASNITTGQEFGKTYFGYIVHVPIGTQTDVTTQYTLPDNFDQTDYQLFIQKQSGVGEIPFAVHLKTSQGEFDQQQTLNNDLTFQFQKQ